MKPVFAKVLEGWDNEVYATRYIDRPYFTTEFHFHKECQLSYILEGEGTRIIGDSVEKFTSDELILLGSNIPHVWHNEEQNLNKSPKQKKHARSVALFFDPDKLIKLLSCFYNTNKLEQVLQTARRGISFHGSAKEQLKALLLKMADTERSEKLILLLQLLQILCVTKKYQLLAGAGYINTYHARDNERIDKVFKYLFNNFSTEIKLDDVASLANMNKQAFCRFFKARTQKTVVEFINEIRIAQAIKLLTAKDAAIKAISFECGYNSISNFNKFFKLITGKTPSEFKRQV